MTTYEPVTKDVEAVDREKMFHWLRQMILIRRFEEKSAELYQASKIRGFMHLYNGEEAIAVGIMGNLTPGDSIVATYREHGQALARGITPESLLAEMYGKVDGCCRGRGGSMHIFDAKTRFYGGNAIVAGGIPMAAGFALADKMQGKPNISVTFFGDGAVSEGEFHETMNMAALWKLPVLFVIENNQYCMGTAIQYHESNINLWEKAANYHIPGERVDGMDIFEVHAASKKAIDFIRSGNGPYLQEYLTYRFRPHSMFDAELYRTKTEVEEWKLRDPITHLKSYMKERELLTDPEVEAIEKEVAAEIQHAIDFAEASAWEPVEDLTRFVHYEGRPE